MWKEAVDCLPPGRQERVTWGGERRGEERVGLSTSGKRGCAKEGELHTQDFIGDDASLQGNEVGTAERTVRPVIHGFGEAGQPHWGMVVFMHPPLWDCRGL